MASSADHVVLNESLEAQDLSVPFEDKKWTYITDASSNGGVYNGVMQFDLNTLSSQNQWTDLSEAYIQFPVRVKIENAGTNAGTNAVPSNFSACIKNGFHQFIESVQLTLGGATVQSSQIFENINASFKAYTEWSSDELKKWGPTLGMSMDDYQLSPDSNQTDYDGLDNIPLTTLSATSVGVMHELDTNPGYKERAHHLNSNAAAGAAYSILGTDKTLIGKGSVSGNGALLTANSSIYTSFYLATVRLKDISDVCGKLPIIKNMKGFLYVYYNAASVSFTQVGTANPSNVTQTAIYGRCMPVSIGEFTGHGTTGTYKITAEVSGESTNLTAATPTRQEARFYSPYFTASPSVDRALSMKKTIRYHERFVTTFDVGANGNYTGTLTPGIVNPKRVVLFPYLVNGSGSEITTFNTNPLLSAWDTVPATTSPFAAIKNLQVEVGCKPMFQQPVQQDFEMFLQELGQSGLDGSLVSETTANGLLDQRKWNQLYRFYTVDVARRMGGDDGSSKSVRVSLTNACNAPMKVVAWILYERQLTIDTAMGQVEQNL